MTGKEKVARRVIEQTNFSMLLYEKYLTPNWILDDIDGMKGATAERRLRELRHDWCGNEWRERKYKRNTIYGYRPSREHENYWEYEKEFIEFLKDYVEQKEKK